MILDSALDVMLQSEIERRANFRTTLQGHFSNRPCAIQNQKNEVRRINFRSVRCQMDFRCPRFDFLLLGDISL